ncbi:unnamed protein product [Ceutorhynchus assimilis]|uniref:Major facilitator superfamily (MFS) profile domain-containing protein n=1 Tax=Ceutorhynchus assimilis TaxID=467358 RepID=A0A9P0DJA0_9CUCU|nr:unnamed protein product [Ceutorhynchus assimilis]
MVEYSLITILTGTILGFIAGSSLTWTSPEITYLNQTDTGPFDGTLTSSDGSWIGGVLSIGAAVGPFLYGYLASLIGLKYTILASTVPFAVSSVISAFANTVAEFLVARLITGIGVGGAFAILPMYIAELAQDEQRGVLGTVMNCFICFGLIFTYVSGYFISKVMAFNLLLAGIACCFFLLFFFIGSESPFYYVQKKQIGMARKTLAKLRNTSEDSVEKELQGIIEEIQKEEKGNIFQIFKSKGTVKAFIIGAGLVFFQQASGINAVLFFAQDIFKQAGTSLEPGYCSMIIGSVQFGTSFITPLASNTFGRKFLLITSGIGMALSESILGIYGILREKNEESVSSLAFLPILSLVLYIITYNIGFGPLPWAVIGEVFPSSVKSSASALSTSICWITSFIITKWFGQVAASLGQGPCFMGFALFSLLAAAFTQFVVLETKGKSLAEIQVDLNK